MGSELGAYPQPPLYRPGNFLCCLWSKQSNPKFPTRTYTRKIPLTNLDDIYKFNQKGIMSPVKSLWLSSINNRPYLVIEVD